MNPLSHQDLLKPRPVREVFAGRGVPEEVLMEQERMDQLIAAHFAKPGSNQPVWVECSIWSDEEV